MHYCGEDLLCVPTVFFISRSLMYTTCWQGTLNKTTQQHRSDHSCNGVHLAGILYSYLSVLSQNKLHGEQELWSMCGLAVRYIYRSCTADTLGDCEAQHQLSPPRHLAPFVQCPFWGRKRSSHWVALSSISRNTVEAQSIWKSLVTVTHKDK